MSVRYVVALSDAEQKRTKLMQRWQNEMSGYANIQSTRPQTLAYAGCR